jgi:creatinine amidohydrolase
VALRCNNVDAETVQISGRRRYAAAGPADDDRRYLTTLGIAAYTDSGVIGYPSRATAAKGRKTLDHLGRNAETLLNILTAPQ